MPSQSTISTSAEGRELHDSKKKGVTFRRRPFQAALMCLPLLARGLRVDPQRYGGIGIALTAMFVIAACSQHRIELAPALVSLPKGTMMLLDKKGMTTDSPLFVRIFKEESELEIWKRREDGRFYHFKTYPICNWSGDLGPKIQHGDKQAPEGFYTVRQKQMNPSSQLHLSFNLGYPNEYDRANRRTGEFLMVHGKCKSAGCYAMTDALIEEIYAVARESFIGGQEFFEVHAFPFRMTDANMLRHKTSPHYPFWATLKEGYDHFERVRQPPSIAICERRYVVNVTLDGRSLARVNPEGACPVFTRPAAEPFKSLGDGNLVEGPNIVPGAKNARDRH